jgi:carbonic anhydrase
MRKAKLFLALLIIVFSSAWVSASSDFECGSKSGWHSLKRSNKKFIRSPKYARQRRATEGGQNPAYVVLSCADSRTPPEIIFNMGLGKIFCPRVAGNTAGDQVIDSIEFAVKTWDVTTVVVMGHDNCGAVVGALERLRENGGIIDPDNGILNAVLIPIEKAIVAAGIDIYGPNALEESIKANVVYTANQLLLKSKGISRALKNGQIIIVGSVYSLRTGKAKELFIIDNCR